MTTLLVASTGGHLAELHDLVPRLGVQDDCVWVTFDSPQSRSLLDGAEVIHVPQATSRDLVGAVRDLVAARRVLRGGRFSQVVSTGASVAASFFLPAVRSRVACHYIESATRTTGPSLTGRMVARMPGTGLYTQYPSWADGCWRYGGSIFDAYVARESAASRQVSRVVVTLGTQKFGFPRLLERLTRIIPASAEVLWQVGSTRIPRMPADARPQVPFAEMQQAMREADVVVTHAGVGSALTALRAGQRAIYVPRRRRYGEHVDDHQVEMARELDRRELVLAREADQVSEADLLLATRWTVSARKEVEPFRWTNPT
ncbi:glycosyltransferase [Micromonospora inyonensis]|uniref:Glycosyltransferase family 28 C-terminal domain-containing protein n=1 Tax=Micromonospora inyonensis TaxID=47866 RepID=A0A1C6RQQ5_9ACTN|nr:glycosyltransferase [Micromonospora inyonensis]SCL19376.1 Glycosyltransferase family 28 C-terminal domain-containing protein [Micromonospora inyonensis]